MKFYLSHSIQGKYGKDATPTQMKENCDAAISIADAIRATLKNATVEIYTPAEHEDFVGIAYRDEYLTIEQVLEIDCKIIDTCDGVIVYVTPDDPLNGGRLVEYCHAEKTNKPVMIFQEMAPVISWLTHQIVRA